MELSEIWLSNDDFQRNVDYLSYSFNRIDSELFSSFNILPLKETNLTVSSMFFADICLRLYPLLTIGFNTLTFGLWMQERVTNWIKTKEEGKSTDYISKIKIEDIVNHLYQLKEKNINENDYVRDYFKFYRKTKYGIHNFFDINGTVIPINRLGRIELYQDIKPFDKKDFNKYLDKRNKIEHRGTVEATLKEAFWAFSSLYLILDTASYFGSNIEIDSNIFGLNKSSPSLETF